MVPENRSNEESMSTIPVYRRGLLALILAIGVVALSFFLFPRMAYKRLTLKTCFHNVAGLRTGAPVRVAGVDVGVVQLVQARPEAQDCPADVELTLSTPYKLQIPSDAIAEINTAGVLGEAYVEIETSKATGPPIKDGGLLKSQDPHHVAPETVRSVVEGIVGLAADEAEASKADGNKAKKQPGIK